MLNNLLNLKFTFLPMFIVSEITGMVIGACVDH